jgi:holin-like protein
MLLLFLTLLVRDGAEQPLRDVAQGLLSNLSLLFVPAGVGVMMHAGRISAEWLSILAGLVLGTAVTMAVTALVMRAAMPGGSDER